MKGSVLIDPSRLDLQKGEAISIRTEGDRVIIERTRIRKGTGIDISRDYVTISGFGVL